ncbi:MAG TPA: heavy metal-associated domain-containing protein [Polyangiales bacterium]|nr:heavy metal-associated domain-containing protein [Polyangiales bacterium]
MNSQESSFEVAGMSCRSCVNHIEHALRDLEGVQRVDVELATGRVRVQHDADVATIDQLLAGFADAGYEANARSPA